MRATSLALLAGVSLAPAVRAGDIRNFEDAALRAVQFVDAKEGWAAGDDGVVWHTIDAGRNWERQPTGVRASLRAVHFLNPYTGWIAGREELPGGQGSGGILLYTQNGGVKWRRVSFNTLPGLNGIRFVNPKVGFAYGDGSEQFPSGLFATADGGRSWKPVTGPRTSAWFGADFRDGQTGALSGAWNRLGTLRQGVLGPADMDSLGGRGVHAVKLIGQGAVAVGDGGLVLLSRENAGARWSFAELPFPTETLAAWDFHAVHVAADHVWAVGRPGSAVLHSADQGQKWEVLQTGQPLPLYGMYFTDTNRGWAVGEFGSVLSTTDGGKTWQVQRRGGQRAAVWFAHAHPAGIPVETIGVLSGVDGYLTAAAAVGSADPASANPLRASESQRLAAAVRSVAGTGAEVFWQFPVAEHLGGADRDEVVRTWNLLHAGRAPEDLLRQLVLGLRMWRPSVVVTDSPAPSAGAVEALVAEAVHEAFERAGDPSVYPEQIKTLGLEPWMPSKLYGRWDKSAGAEVVVECNEPCSRLQGTAREFASPAGRLLGVDAEGLPPQRYYHLLASHLDGAAGHRDLMEGVSLAPGGVARRLVTPPTEPAETAKAIRTRRNLQAIVESPITNPANSGALLAQVGDSLKALPADQAPAAAFALAGHYVRTGQWDYARELYLLLVERYPTHPLAADACRWLIRHAVSSEARRRRELGQYYVISQAEYRQFKFGDTPQPSAPLRKAYARVKGDGVEQDGQQQVGVLANQNETAQGYQSALELAKHLESLGPVFTQDPSIQFCLHAARRRLGDFEMARSGYARFAAEHPEGPWHDAAAAEQWLADRTGPAPKPVLSCRYASERPYLDGKLDDACWQAAKPMALKNAVGQTAKEYPTEVRLAYDKEFFYLALHCRHPQDRYVAPVKSRSRDSDVRPFDHVDVVLDLDRDYSTCFRFQVDQRGCACEDCWGDKGWDPRWFVAVKSDPTGWDVEAAIPLAELTGDPVSAGQAWCVNVTRVLPGRGVQAWSVPADAEPRPEGMGLLLFAQDLAPKNPTAPLTPAK